MGFKLANGIITWPASLSYLIPPFEKNRLLPRIFCDIKLNWVPLLIPNISNLDVRHYLGKPFNFHSKTGFETKLKLWMTIWLMSSSSKHNEVPGIFFALTPCNRNCSANGKKSMRRVFCGVEGFSKLVYEFHEPAACVRYIPQIQRVLKFQISFTAVLFYFSTIIKWEGLNQFWCKCLWFSRCMWYIYIQCMRSQDHPLL